MFADVGMVVREDTYFKGQVGVEVNNLRLFLCPYIP